jgi:signal transduction histidine kinase
MSYLRTNKVQLAAIFVLAGLLVVLAIVQYRWLGQISEWERERMQRSIEFATRVMLAEFDGELGELYRTFQIDFREEGSPAEQLAARYAERVNTLEGPDPLERIYLVTINEDSGLLIEEFTGTALMPLDEWPPALAHLEKQFAGTLKHNNAQFDLLVGPPPLQDDIPALVIQQVQNRPRNTLASTPPSISWIVVKLDRDVLLGEFISGLADRYIFGEGQVNYNVGVLDEEGPQALLWASDPTLTAASFIEPDSRRGIYSLRFWDFNLRNLNQRRMWRVVEESAESRWSLVTKHQAGSLEAAVSSARNRSLALSLGVLLLLAGSILMIVVSTRRAQHLAEQQMEFVAGVSHELRTPLSVIRAAAENLADDVVHDADRTRQYGQLIDREGRRLSDMVERVLLFAKIRSGQDHLERAPVDLAGVIDEAIAANSSLISDQQVTVERDVSTPLPVVNGDGQALTSALQNLLSNAIKYSHRGGVVRLRARGVMGNGRPVVQVTIRDEGAGIPAAELPHVFEPFFRGERARRAQIQGSGLGLSLVKQVIEAHDGSVRLESTANRGSTFTVELPAAEG